MSKDSLSAYRRSQIQGMSQVDLILTLYQGAIRFLAGGIDLLSAGRYDRSWQEFDRARRIVVHLCGTLNPEAGDLTAKFSALYAFVIEQIAVANAHKDAAAARNCIEILTTLKEGWEEIAARGDEAILGPAGRETTAESAGMAAGTFCMQA